MHRESAREKDGVPSARFGTERSEVQILSPRPIESKLTAANISGRISFSQFAVSSTT